MSWLGRLTSGLSKSSQQLSEGITGIFTKSRLDEEALEELEELLIASDMGVAAAMEVTEQLRNRRFDKDITPEAVKQVLAEELAQLLAPVAAPLQLSDAKPHIVLVVGVNGNGKTTTIGKLAKQLQAQGNRVMLAAADTFRAAAVEQLQVWAERVNCPIVTGENQADPASVAFRAAEQAREQGADVLLIDTAGRLHNKANLMEELKKIIRVLQKQMPDAPHSVLQVLDGTTGQNALQQVKAFKELVNVDGLVVTKLDGTAKAGVVVALAKEFELPIHAIGVGEQVDDLQPFTAESFAARLVGASELQNAA